MKQIQIQVPAIAAGFVAAEGNAHVAAQVGVHPHSSRV